MEYGCLEYGIPEPGIARIELRRPERLNAINARLLREFDHALRRIEADPEIRVWILGGAARPDGRPCFSAGVDLKAGAEGEMVGETQGYELCNRIDDALKPSIAAIDGVCSTGGAELALACDFRLVGAAAQISDWHLKHLGTGLGGWGASTRWARLVGVQNAKEIILTGRALDAEAALRMGFASAAHPSDQLGSAALALARSIAGMDPRGVRLTLMHLDRGLDLSKDQALRFAQLLYQWFPSQLDFDAKARALLSEKQLSAKASGDRG